MKFVVLAAVLTVLAVPLRAQKLDNFVGKYGSANGGGYMQPLADAFAANLNSGLFHTARVPPDGFHLALDVLVIGAPVADSRKTFQAQTEGAFTPQSSTQAPTIFGSTQGASVQGVGGTTYNFPGGLSVNMLAIAVPQLTIGSLYGTEALIRFFQAKLGDSFGTLKLFGVGVRHNLNQHFKLRQEPMSLAAGIYYQRFDVGDIVSASALFISAQASYRMGVLVVYGGPGFERSTMDISYQGSSGKINVSLTAANTIRFTLGAALELAFLRLFADYNLASQSTFALGIGFGF